MLGGYSGKREGAGVAVAPPEERVQIQNATTQHLWSPAGGFVSMKERDNNNNNNKQRLEKREGESPIQEKAQQETAGPRRGRHLALFHKRE